MKRLTNFSLIVILRTIAGVLSFLVISLTSCSDDANDLLPITLRDKEEPSITFFYQGQESGYSFPLQGGDGNYFVNSGNEEVVAVKMISPNDLSITVKGIGKTIVIVTDNSQNTLVVNVQVDYETHNWVVVRHDVTVYGHDLTVNEIKAIKEKQLTQIPVKTGGGYKFIHSDVPNNKGKAIIYPNTYGYDGIVTTFEYKRIENKVVPETSSLGYEVAIDNEKRLFVLWRYYPSTLSSRYTETIKIALVEDVTEKVQMEYPKAELVYIFQVVEGKSY